MIVGNERYSDFVILMTWKEVGLAFSKEQTAAMGKLLGSVLSAFSW
jgi:hypothetical protein